MKYVHHYTVNGHEKFPIDMLRYDGSYPAAETESYKITEEGLKDRTVKLVHCGEKNWEPGKLRWSSFGWQVVEHRSFKK